jgi:Gpi18-like mannosyltransferase
MFKIHVSREILMVLLSVLIQVPLAIFLGHYYDERSFIDTGYLVSVGLNPYQPHSITVFSNPDLVGINPIIGYPPLWPLLLGLIYRLTYNIAPNIFLYNFAIKIPVIASNIGLAYIVKTVMQRLGEPEKKIKIAFLFLLFNPFILLTTAAWGEFDTLIAFLCIASLYFLSKCMVGKSSLLLSLSLVLKPIAVPLVGLPFLCYPTEKMKKIAIYLLVAILVLLVLWFVPFYLLHWIVPSSGFQLTAYFRMAGGMTLFSAVEIFTNTSTLPSGLGFLGYLWIPALLIGYYFVYRNPPKTFNDLAKASLALLLIFFLTRTWISEPNLNLIISFALLALAVKEWNFRNFAFLWIFPLIFLFLNTSFAQLFFLVQPSIIPTLVQIDLQIRFWRLIARFIIVVIWQIFAWRLVIKMLNRKKNSEGKQ